MVTKFFQDRHFFSAFLTIAIPITIQQFFSALTGMLDVLMVGQLGETAIASLGLANQIFFLLTILIFGINSGIAIFTAQYWGKGDIYNLRRVMGIGLTLCSAVAIIYSIAAIFFPEKVLGFYTNDQEVIDLGSNYLRIVGFSYIPTAISLAFASVLRSSQNVRLPMLVTIFALSLKIFLNFLLIFGNLGFPKLGVEGAAIGTMIARTLEFIFIVYLSYRYRTAAAAKIQELKFSFVFFKKVLWTSLPAAINEFFWSMGITTYNAVYAHIGTDAIAAININGTIENMSFVIFIGLANSCAIMIGNQIGAGREDLAYEYGKRFMILGISSALIIGVLVILLRPLVLSLYNIQAESYRFAYTILLIYGLTMWIRVSNLIIFIGLLRSGGDTRFALILEMCSIWLIGVPSAFIGAFVLDWPVFGVYALVLSEEVFKLIFVLPRVKSKKWINNLTEVVT
ncbi:MAG: MATE family efflux transporter [Anaerolineaceae bacterium]